MVLFATLLLLLDLSHANAGEAPSVHDELRSIADCARNSGRNCQPAKLIDGEWAQMDLEGTFHLFQRTITGDSLILQCAAGHSSVHIIADEPWRSDPNVILKFDQAQAYSPLGVQAIGHRLDLGTDRLVAKLAASNSFVFQAVSASGQTRTSVFNVGRLRLVWDGLVDRCPNVQLTYE